jgi:sialate O-acetylesterase
MSAGGPFTLSIKGKKEIILKDVMIGEVWVASGQSNMTFELAGSVGAAEELRKADYPEIRLFNVPKIAATDSKEDTLPASWQICTPDAARHFSAVAYYFARDLHRKLHVPVGIVESAWPGTAIEEWTEPAALASISGSSPEKTSGSAQRLPFHLEFDDFQLVRDLTDSSEADLFSGFDDGTSRNSLGGYWSYDWQDAPATSLDLVSPGRQGTGYAMQVAGTLDASGDSRLISRFHADNSPADLSSYAGMRFWVRGEGSFRVLTLQPTITDWDDYGSQMFHASPEWKRITLPFRDLKQEGWGVSEDITLATLSGFAIECLPATGYPSRPPSSLYEGMIAPLMPYPFRGAVWYQGEGNALDALHYRKLLPALIESWRKASHNEFPFLIVQLPNHGTIPEEPSESAWAELREAQLLASKTVPNTGLAVTIDVGDPKDLHPHRKAEVGQRLALWALGTIYGEPMVYSGPIYQAMKIEGSHISIHFTNVGGGLVGDASGRIRGFTIAGVDRKFYWADGVIQGDTVLVSSPKVPDPVAVRYAWGDSPNCDLHNRENLPASPFRTDDWPGITGKH